jgi:hypothetical protein
LRTFLIAANEIPGEKSHCRFQLVQSTCNQSDARTQA